MTPNRPRILAIDDTPANLMVLARALSPDYQFQIATSGSEGLAIADAAPPDIVLLDVMMPEMDGHETCRRFKANPKLRDLPIVFVTALSDSTAEVSGLSLGAADYLHKPLNVSIARQRISNLIEQAALRREIEQHRNHLEQLVTERTLSLQQANVQLNAAKEASECASRAKAAFIANISHELFTPLNVILGMNTLIRPHLPPEMLTMSERLDYAAQQMQNIIKRVLQLSALEGDNSAVDAATKFHVHEILDIAMAHSYAQATAKGLKLVLDIAPNVPKSMHGMSSAIRQVVENFLSNAIKFSDAGCITVRAEIATVADDHVNLKIEVEDQGIGIAESDIEKLFQEFSQADDAVDRRHYGIGVGLAINRHLAKMMGGQIGVESVPGKGSRFWIVVPLYHFTYTWFAADVDDSADIVPPTLTSPPTGHVPVSNVDLTPTLDRLQVLLSQNDIMAQQVWEASKTLLEPFLGSRATALAHALADYSFEDAAVILEAARQDLNSNPIHPDQ